MAGIHQNRVQPMRRHARQSISRCHRWPLRCQSVGTPSSSDFGRLRGQFRQRDAASLYVRGQGDQGAPLLQVHASGRQIRRGGFTTGSARPLHASYSTHLSTREKRGFPRPIRLGRWMGRPSGWIEAAPEDAASRRRTCDRQPGLREVASFQRHQCCNLRRDDVRRLPRRRQGLLSG